MGGVSAGAGEEALRTWEEEKKMRDWGRAAAKRTVTAGRLPDLALVRFN